MSLIHIIHSLLIQHALTNLTNKDYLNNQKEKLYCTKGAYPDCLAVTTQSSLDHLYWGCTCGSEVACLVAPTTMHNSLHSATVLCSNTLLSWTTWWPE